jgi:hypothetical protein
MRGTKKKHSKWNKFCISKATTTTNITTITIAATTTNCINQYFWENNTRAAFQENLCILRHRSFYYKVYESPPLVRILYDTYSI